MFLPDCILGHLLPSLPHRCFWDFVNVLLHDAKQHTNYTHTIITPNIHDANCKQSCLYGMFFIVWRRAPSYEPIYQHWSSILKFQKRVKILLEILPGRGVIWIIQYLKQVKYCKRACSFSFLHILIWSVTFRFIHLCSSLYRKWNL